MRTSGGSVRRFSSVLCPVDFSDHSRVALRFAAAVCRRTHAPLRVLFVNDPLLVAAAAAAYNSTTLAAATRTELQRFVAATLPPRTVSSTLLTYATALGKPAREILRAAERGRHDAIVIGTKGLNGAKRLLLGSTTAEVLRRARVPVLAVPSADPQPAGGGTVPTKWPGRKVVAAIEFGPRAASDVRQAAEVARWFDARLLLVHVVPVPSIPPWLTSDVESHLRIQCGEAETALDALSASLRDVRTTTLGTRGAPAGGNRRRRCRAEGGTDRHGAARTRWVLR